MSLTIDNTGVRSYEYVGDFNGAKQTKGTLFQIRFSDGVFFPPYYKYYQMNNPAVRDQLNWGFFKDMTWEQREYWIRSNVTDRDIYLSDLPCELKFIKLGADFNTKLSAEDQQTLMRGEWIDMRVVYEMFPRKPGSNAARHTLIFRGSNWQIVNMDTMYQFSEYMNVLTGEFSNQKNNNNVYRAELKVDSNTFYIGVCDEEPYTNLDSYIDLDVKREISWFTPSVHKSLIQKCIRVRPLNVRINGRLYPTEKILITSFVMLVQQNLASL